METKRLSQKAIILSRLRYAGVRGVCATVFLGMRIPRYAARIGELRREGHTIVTEDCTWHQHETRQVQYRLVIGEQGGLF